MGYRHWKPAYFLASVAAAYCVGWPGRYSGAGPREEAAAAAAAAEEEPVKAGLEGFTRRMSVSSKSEMLPSEGSDRSLSDTSSTLGCDIAREKRGLFFVKRLAESFVLERGGTKESKKKGGLSAVGEGG